MDLKEFQNLVNSELVRTSIFIPKKLLEKAREYRINYREAFTLGLRSRLTEVDRITEISKSNEEYKQQVEVYLREIKNLREITKVLVERENQRIDEKNKEIKI